jgi:putative endonuclease
MSETNETGKAGEAVACTYLKMCGYTILHTNWRFHRYELDIVAANGRELVVVEVKTRSANWLVAPEQAVDRHKIQRIVAAADAYACKYNVTLPVRFDVLCLMKKNNAYSVEEHIEDAFYAPVK